jgi:hypothetical protein
MKIGGHPMESVSHGLRKKEKRWGGVPKFYKKEHQCAKILKNSEPLSLVYYGR